jgi:hypothetical protein
MFGVFDVVFLRREKKNVTSAQNLSSKQLLSLSLNNFLNEC